MRRDLRSCALYGPVVPGDDTRAMMIKHFLTICAAATAAAAGTSLAQAQQSYPVQQAPTYQQGYPTEYRPGDRVPNFDGLDDDDDGMPSQPRNSAALPPPGPVMSPDDPR